MNHLCRTSHADGVSPPCKHEVTILLNMNWYEALKLNARDDSHDGSHPFGQCTWPLHSDD